MRSLLDALQTPAPLTFDDLRAGCIASRNQTCSRLHVFVSRVDFWGTWGGFGRSKWRLKSIFGRLFAMPSPSTLLNRFFGDFLKSDPWFFCAQPVFCTDFHLFEEAVKKTNLESILGGQSDNKSRKRSLEKYHSFEYRLFRVICWISMFLNRIWEALELQKTVKNW